MFFCCCWNTLVNLQKTSGDCNIFVGLNRIAGKLLIFTGFNCSLLHLASNLKLVKIGHSRHYAFIQFRFGSWFLRWRSILLQNPEIGKWKYEIFKFFQFFSNLLAIQVLSSKFQNIYIDFQGIRTFQKCCTTIIPVE